MAEVLKKFGRYFLLEHLAQGGMAEIYLARLASTDGAARLLVIKRIQAGYGENSEFLQMFRSEIKVTMGFNHPNIVQLYDFGEEQSQPFIAMEYVDGKNLRQFVNRFTQLKQSFPVELATYVAEQCAGGLHYAHSFKDKITGQALNVVHRDISPQNILLSFEGNVRIIDFGIAKATTNSESTRVGVIKGKPSYLSPEQISGEVLDGRSDVFALGAVLWEMLTCKKLFAGENDLAVLKLIESAATYVKPPSTLNPKVPPELDAIVMKALTKNRDKRYLNAEEMQRALHRFLYSFAPDFNPADLGYFAKDLFKDEIVEERKKIQKLNEKAEQLILAHAAASSAQPLPSGGSAMPVPSALKDEAPTVVGLPRQTSSGARDVFSVDGSKSTTVEIEKSPQTRSGAAGTPAIPRLGAKKVAAPVQTVSNQPLTSLAAGSNSKLYFAGIAAAVLLIIFAPELGIEIPYLSEIARSLQGGDPSKKIEAKATGHRSTAAVVPGNGKSIQLKLNITPVGENITIKLNGGLINSVKPSVQVPLGSPLELVVEGPEIKTFTREFVLNAKELGGLAEISQDIALEPLHYGTLTVHSTPSADIFINGVKYPKKTPIEEEKIKPGTYQLRLVNDVLGMELEKKIEILERKSLVVQDSLKLQK